MSAAPVRDASADPAAPAEVLALDDRRWPALEAERVATGLSVPLVHRHDWAAAAGAGHAFLAAVRAGDGRCVGAAAAALADSRALPGYRIARVERLGTNCTSEAIEPMALALRELARAVPRVLRLHAEVITRDEALGARWSGALAAAGFRRLPSPRNYARSLVLDLAPTEETLLAALGRQVRRNVRVGERLPVEVRAITDVALAPRLDALMIETLARTGASYAPLPWTHIIAYSARHPEQSRLVGLFRTDASGPEALLGLAWGCHHGDHAHYDAGASTRQTELKVAIAYPLIWDLLVWARRQGANWFDFGGVTEGSTDSDDALGGISDFKRGFSKDVATIGQEWVYEPSALLARTAESLGGIARRVARLRAGRHTPAA